MRSILKASAAMSALAGLAAPAYAQQVDEIIVEAERRAESLEDVPIAVSAFAEKDLVKRQIDEPLDLIDYVPNLYGGNNTGLGSANMYYIRGLGNTESIATFDPPVGTYVDEVYVARQNANNVSFYDVERIEVLRGPQGTLFGRNTTGGAFNVKMKKPAEEFGGFLEAGYGSFDRKLVRGSVDLPVVADGLLTKVSAYWVDDGGYVDNTTTGETLNGQDAFGVRGDLRFLFGERATWDVAVDYSEDDETNILNFVEGGTPLAAATDAGRRISRTGVRVARDSRPLLTQLLAGQGLGAENETVSVTSNLGLKALGGDINFIVGVRRLDQEFVLDFFDGGLGGQRYRTGGFAIANDGEHNQFSAELKYAASLFGDFVDVISGLYFFSERNNTNFADVFTIDADPGPGIIPVPLVLANRVLDNDLDSYAVYAQGDIHLSDRLTFTAGARWTQEEKEISYSDNRAPNPPSLPATALLNDANLVAAGVPLKQTKALVTPRFVLAYEFSDDANVFASATKGFKSGGWNARGTSPALIQPFFREAVWSYEAGLRSFLFDKRARLNITGFWTDVDGFQAPSAFVAPNGSISFITRNFADLENKGVEVETELAVTEALSLYATFGWQDAEYKNLDASILAQATACATNPSQGGLGIVAPNCSISEPVRVPDISLSVGASYDLEIPGLGAMLTPSINARHASSTFTGTSNLPNSFEDGFWLVNAGVTLTKGEAWRLSAECSNCTNTIYITSNLPPTVYLNDPRRWGVRLRRDF
jgi:iron complex outermembrane receptor protein